MTEKKQTKGKGKEPPIIYVCKKCGKAMPTDEAKSNKNWRALKMVCPCGGKGEWKVNQ